MQSSSEQTIEKIAGILANRAAFVEATTPQVKQADGDWKTKLKDTVSSVSKSLTGETSSAPSGGLQKWISSNPAVVAGLGGAGIGALAGLGSSYMNKDPRDRQPGYNALLGGLAGGAAGFGGGLIYSQPGNRKAIQNAVDGVARASTAALKPSTNSKLPPPKMESFSTSISDAPITAAAAAGTGLAHLRAREYHNTAAALRAGVSDELGKVLPADGFRAAKTWASDIRTPEDYYDLLENGGKIQWSEDLKGGGSKLMEHKLNATALKDLTAKGKPLVAKHRLRTPAGIAATLATLAGGGYLEQRANVMRRNRLKKLDYLKQLTENNK